MIELLCRTAESQRGKQQHLKMQLLGWIHLKMGKVSGRNSNSLVPVTTAVGRDIRVAIAGKRVVEKLDRCLKDGNRMERSPKTRRTRRLVAQRILQMNRIARGWP